MLRLPPFWVAEFGGRDGRLWLPADQASVSTLLVRIFRREFEQHRHRLDGSGVEVVESQLAAVHVERAYDAHEGPPTELGQGTCFP